MWRACLTRKGWCLEGWWTLFCSGEYYKKFSFWSLVLGTLLQDFSCRSKHLWRLLLFFLLTCLPYRIYLLWIFQSVSHKRASWCVQMDHGMQPRAEACRTGRSYNFLRRRRYVHTRCSAPAASRLRGATIGCSPPHFRFSMSRSSKLFGWVAKLCAASSDCCLTASGDMDEDGHRAASAACFRVVCVCMEPYCMQ